MSAAVASPKNKNKKQFFPQTNNLDQTRYSWSAVKHLFLLLIVCSSPVLSWSSNILHRRSHSQRRGLGMSLRMKLLTVPSYRLEGSWNVTWNCIMHGIVVLMTVKSKLDSAIQSTIYNSGLHNKSLAQHVTMVYNSCLHGNMPRMVVSMATYPYGSGQWSQWQLVLMAQDSGPNGNLSLWPRTVVPMAAHYKSLALNVHQPTLFSSLYHSFYLQQQKLQ